MTRQHSASDSGLRSVLIIGVAVALTAVIGCAPATDETQSGRPPATAPSSPSTSLPPANEARADACGAAARQDWVGRSVDGLPPPPSGANWRRVCTTCQKTDDFRPERLNIAFDETSRRVVSVACG